MFYVYEWYVVETNEVFYVGKGTGRRYKVLKHNKFFNDFIKRYNCESRIVKEFENEQDAFSYEYIRINELRQIGQCVCNIYDGGTGGTQSWWTEELRQKYSQNNVMRSESQRQRMRENNPMKRKDVALKNGKSHTKRVIIDDVLFDSIKDGAKHIGTSDIYLTHCLTHKNGKCKGHICKYGNQQPSQGNTDKSTLKGSTTNE